MAYSNGYNLSSVLTKLFGRLAWGGDASLNTANKTSASGRYFDDGSFHSLVTVANIKATVPEPVSPATWDTIFTAKQNAVIAKSLSAVFNKPQFQEQAILYERFNEVEAEIPNAGKAVGYRITVAKSLDMSVQINSLELYFNEVKTFNVYLYKQGSTTALQTKSVTTVANTKTTVALTDWILNYKESAVYYVVYYQNDLDTCKAIREQVEFHKTFLFAAIPFEAPLISAGIFDRTQVSIFVNDPYMSDPHGINMQVTAFGDITQNIINQAHLFDELLGLNMAYQVIEDVIYSVQSGNKERILKEQLDKIGIQLDLNGAAPISESPKVIGFRQRIEKEIERIRKAFYPEPSAQSVNIKECSL